ncbi:MAG TPA: hypothetical protein VHD56_03975 [Tepidisphaeraceae bacterium]|nr:hypothetical protein [Tepidisphaeraceae bacterium]
MGKMTSNRPNCSGLGLGILVALFCHQVSKADVTAEEIISRHRTSVEAIHTYHFESDNFNQSMNSKDQGKTVFQRSRMEIVADREHSRLKVYTSRTANPDEALVEEKSQIQLFVWDGKVNYEYRITPGEGTPESRGILFRTKDVAENDSHLRNMDSGVALDGVFKGNVESIKKSFDGRKRSICEMGQTLWEVLNVM